jgi:hypothetical protein
MGAGNLRELPIEPGDLFLESMDFVDDERDHLPKRRPGWPRLGQ